MSEALAIICTPPNTVRGLTQPSTLRGTVTKNQLCELTDNSDSESIRSSGYMSRPAAQPPRSGIRRPAASWQEGSGAI